MHAYLEVNEFVEVFVLLIRVFLHELGKGLAFYVVIDYGPASILHGGDLMDLWNMQPGLLDTGLVQGFVEDVGLGEALVEHLVAKVSLPVYGLMLSCGYHIV